MGYPCFFLALVFDLLATGGYIVYLIKQKKWMSRTSCLLLFIGFLFHSVFLCRQYVVLGTAPVLDLKSALSFFSWCVILVFLIFHLKFRIMVLGSFVAPFAAFLMIISSAMPWTAGPVKPIFKSIWLTIHVGTIFLGNGLFAITFLVAVMYLIQEHQIKQKRFGSFFSRLPSLATLDSINYYALISGFPFLTIGMITGSIYAQIALGAYWQWDPKEVWSLVTWLFYAALLHERLTVGWRGRRAAVMSIICFSVLLFTFVGVSLWFKGYHNFGALGTGGV
jgi:cytochrome c-type biogenesis protein CcsB